MMDITGSHRLHRPERPVPLRGMPDFDEERGHAGQDFRPRRQVRFDRPISRRGSDWIHHISFLINALGKWVQSDPFYPLAIYPAISNSCMPKWFTGHRVRCTSFRDFFDDLDTVLGDDGLSRRIGPRQALSISAQMASIKRRITITLMPHSSFFIVEQSAFRS